MHGVPSLKVKALIGKNPGFAVAVVLALICGALALAIGGEPRRLKNYLYWAASWLPTAFLHSHMTGAESFPDATSDGD